MRATVAHMAAYKPRKYWGLKFIEGSLPTEPPSPAETKAIDQAIADAQRFIRLAARIIPKPERQANMSYEPDPERGVAVLRNTHTGEVIRERLLCTKNTKFGHPCRSFAIGDLGTCFSHATETELETLGFSRNSIKRKPRTMLALDALVEQEIDGIYQVYFDALNAIDPVSKRPDHGMRMRAADALLDRAHGKPTSKQEITGADGDDLTLVTLFAENPADQTDTE